MCFCKLFQLQWAQSAVSFLLTPSPLTLLGLGRVGVTTLPFKVVLDGRAYFICIVLSDFSQKGPPTPKYKLQAPQTDLPLLPSPDCFYDL